MTEILVERHWDEALTDDSMQSMLMSAGECLGLHRVDWHASRLSKDGHELFCHFSAADAESVRIALDQAGSPRGSVWAGTVHDAPGCNEELLAQVNVLACRSFETPMTIEQLEASIRAAPICLTTHGVFEARTYLAADGKRAVHVFKAPDAESVRIGLRAAAVPVERVWAFRQFQP